MGFMPRGCAAARAHLTPARARSCKADANVGANILALPAFAGLSAPESPCRYTAAGMTVRTFFVRRALRPLLPLAICAGLAACASAPVPPLPMGDLPAAWRNAAAGARAPAPDLHGWWKAFGDPQLNDLVDQALRDNLDVQQAALHLRAARELESVSGAAYKPQLAFRTLST